MRVFVTGVNGQLGHDVILELNKRNIEALASDLTNTPHNLDITDSNQVNNLLLSLKPDVIIHCAAYTLVDKAEEDKDTCYKVNVIGTKNLVEVAKKLNSKFIYLSTDYVFGDDNLNPHKADDKDFNPLNVYGKTKLEGELIVSKELTKYYIVRTSWAYGLNGNNFVKTMLKLSETQSELKVVNNQIGSPTNTIDLSRLLVDMALTDKYGYYHATNEGDYISWADFATKIFELSNKNTKVIPVTTQEYGKSKAIRPLNSRLDKTKLKDNGFEPLNNWDLSLKTFVFNKQREDKRYFVDIVFVILHYNTINETINLVKSIIKKIDTPKYKIIIVDNCSPNNTGKELKNYYRDLESVDVVLLNKNMGFACGNNEGIKYAIEKYSFSFLCCINNDTEIISNNFYHLLRKEYNHSKAAIIGPLVILKNNKIQKTPYKLNTINYYKSKLEMYENPSKRIKRNNNDIFSTLYNVVSNRIIKNIFVITKHYNVVLHGSCLVFTQKFFEKLPGFNQNTFLYREEEILFLEARRKNLLTVYYPKIKIKHFEDAATNTVVKTSKEKEEFIRINQINSLKILIDELSKEQ